MNKQKTITVDDFYSHIMKFMTAEEALKKLLQSSLINYKHLKFKKGKEIHPEFVIVNAALELGWCISVEKDEPVVRGMTIGTEEYIKKLFPKNILPNLEHKKSE